MRIITLNNAVEELKKGDVIHIEPIYKYKSTKYFRVLKDITVELSSREIVTIPVGFETDGSTSPKFLWSLFPPLGKFLLAALIHDYLYVARPLKKKRMWVDMEMLRWSNKINKNKVDNVIRYIMACIVGVLYWLRILKFDRTLEND